MTVLLPVQRSATDADGTDTWTVVVASAAELEELLRRARVDGWSVRQAVVRGGAVEVTLHR